MKGLTEMGVSVLEQYGNITRQPYVRYDWTDANGQPTCVFWRFDSQDGTIGFRGQKPSEGWFATSLSQFEQLAEILPAIVADMGERQAAIWEARCGPATAEVSA